MTRQFAVLDWVENNEVITEESHYEFIHGIQNALMLALREQECLNVMQYRQAAENLKRKRLDRAKRILERGEMGW